jgi:hypothetical protein
MEFIVIVLFIIVVLVVYFLMQYWWMVLIALGLGGIAGIILVVIDGCKLCNVVNAEVIDEVPIIERVSEKTGHTTSYGRGLSYHEHYRDRDVITGYNVTFAVVYKSGKRGVITCKKDSVTYNKLINK